MKNMKKITDEIRKVIKKTVKVISVQYNGKTTLRVEIDQYYVSTHELNKVLKEHNLIVGTIFIGSKKNTMSLFLWELTCDGKIK